MNKYIVISAIVSVLFTIIKYSLTYTENKRPNIKDSILVFVCTLASLYGYDNYLDKATSPKLSEIFTGPPEF